MLTGQALINDVDRAEVRFGEYALWWLGQHSFILKLEKKILYLDLFLSSLPNRQVSPLLNADVIHHADLFLGTHDHTDHIDREIWPALAQASPNAKFIVPELLRETLAKDLNITIERFVGLDDNTVVEIDGVKITGIAAAHEFLDRDEATGRYPYLGYVIEGNGCTLYHSGDCCIYEGLVTKLRYWRFDVVLLPINGRDAKRLASGCIGNMTYQEAADLAGVLEPELTIPTHYDMFALNAEDPKLFIDYMKVKYPALKTQLCEYGTRLF
jgi:L-ascorbate metabolism protein UlaG (beta-lactamase superfamily)